VFKGGGECSGRERERGRTGWVWASESRALRLAAGTQSELMHKRYTSELTGVWNHRKPGQEGEIEK